MTNPTIPTLLTKGAKMAGEFRARFSKGKIEPLEEVDFEEGEEIRVIVPDRPKGKDMIEALRASTNGWKNLVDGEELKRNIYNDRLINTSPEPRI